MPTTYNTIGTQYSGKKHLHQIQSQCEHCGQQATLSSYDTVKYFVILHLPLIPLQKLRVINECGLCHQHHWLKQNDWDDAKAKQIVAALTRLKAEPTNGEAVQAAIATACGFQDKPLFEATVSSLLPELAKDHEVQVSIAEGQRYFGNLEESIVAFRKALAAKDDEATRERMASALIMLGRPDQAVPLLSHINGPESLENAGYLWLLARGFQTQGMHAEAISVFDRLLQVQPVLENNKEYKKLRKLSEKNLVSGKRIKAADLSKSEAGYRDQTLGSRLAPWIGPMVAALLVFLYFFVAIYKGQSRPVYVVNGLNVPYTAVINGSELLLQPRAPAKLYLPEGDIEIAGKGDGFEIPKTNVQLSTNFWSRPFVGAVFVINPDINAILVQEKLYYAPPDRTPPEGEQKLSLVKAMHQFPGMNFVFEDAPQSIKMKRGSTVSRTRVGLIPNEMKDLELFALAQVSLMDSEEADAESKMQQWLSIRQQSSPDSEQLLGLIDRIYPDESVEMIKPQLTMRPVRVNVHRLYQKSTEKKRPEYDLSDEYEKLLAAEPENGELAYLAGRVAKTAVARAAHFQKAMDSNPPVAFAASAIGYELMSEGKFEEALSYLNKAVEIKPDMFTFQWSRKDCWIALKKSDEIITWARSTSLGSLSGIPLFSIEASALVQANRGQELAELKGRFQRAMHDFGDPATVEEQWAAVSKAAEYVRAGAAQNSLPQAALADVESVRESLKNEGDDDGLSTQNLFLFVMESSNNQLDVAKTHLDAAIALLEKGGPEERRMAAALGPDGESNPDELLKLLGQCRDKLAWISALAVRFPHDSAKYKSLAAKLNVEPVPPYWWLNQWLGLP